MNPVGNPMVNHSNNTAGLNPKIAANEKNLQHAIRMKCCNNFKIDFETAKLDNVETMRLMRYLLIGERPELMPAEVLIPSYTANKANYVNAAGSEQQYISDVMIILCNDLLDISFVEKFNVIFYDNKMADVIKKIHFHNLFNEYIYSEKSDFIPLPSSAPVTPLVCNPPTDVKQIKKVTSLTTWLKEFLQSNTGDEFFLEMLLYSWGSILQPKWEIKFKQYKRECKFNGEKPIEFNIRVRGKIAKKLSPAVRALYEKKCTLQCDDYEMKKTVVRNFLNTVLKDKKAACEDEVEKLEMAIAKAPSQDVIELFMFTLQLTTKSVLSALYESALNAVQTLRSAAQTEDFILDIKNKLFALIPETIFGKDILKKYPKSDNKQLADFNKYLKTALAAVRGETQIKYQLYAGEKKFVTSDTGVITLEDPPRPELPPFAYNGPKAEIFSREFNSGRVNVCVSMLNDVIPENDQGLVKPDQIIHTVQDSMQQRLIESHAVVNPLSSNSNFSATAFGNMTKVNLPGSLSKDPADKLNIGFVFNPHQLKHIDVAVAGDGHTSKGGESQLVHDELHHYMAYSTAIPDVVARKNKAFLSDVPRIYNDEIIKSLVMHTNKREPAKSRSNELLVMPKSKNFFDAVNYILVDNSKGQHGRIGQYGRICQHPDWDNVVVLAKRAEKPILILQKAENGLLQLTSYDPK